MLIARNFATHCETPSKLLINIVQRECVISLIALLKLQLNAEITYRGTLLVLAVEN